jgi:hypothetical protein
MFFHILFFEFLPYMFCFVLFFFCILASKIILFQEALQFEETIIFYYYRQNNMGMVTRVLPPLTWHILIIVDSLGLVVIACIMNQSRGHWLLSDALNFSLFMSLKFRNENDFATFDNLLEEDANVAFEFSCLASNIKNEVVGVELFFFLLKEI